MEGTLRGRVGRGFVRRGCLGRSYTLPGKTNREGCCDLRRVFEAKASPHPVIHVQVPTLMRHNNIKKKQRRIAAAILTTMIIMALSVHKINSHSPLLSYLCRGNVRVGIRV